MQARRDAPLPATHARELAAHTAACKQCDAYAGEIDTLASLLAELPVAEPAANFEWKLKLRLAAVERESTAVEWPLAPARRAWRTSFEFGGAVAIAATIVVAIGLASWRGPAPTTSIAPPPSPPSGGRVTALRGTPVPIGPRQPSAAEYLAGGVADSSAADSLR
jgi:hypothetical protein